MNLQQSRALFFKTIFPFGLVGGSIFFIYSLILLYLGYNPLAGSPYGYRDFDLILLIIFSCILLVRYNYQFPGNNPFWEIFFITFIGSLIALLFYLILTFLLSSFSPDLLINLAEENKKFIIDHKNEFIDNAGSKGFIISLKNIKTISPANLFFSELIKKGIITMILSAFISIIFRFTNLIFNKKNKKIEINLS